MYVCIAVVILHFTLVDPLNPKPITEDLPNALPLPRYWTLQRYIQPAPGLPLAHSLVISSASSLPIGRVKCLVSLTSCHPGLFGENPCPLHAAGQDSVPTNCLSFLAHGHVVGFQNIPSSSERVIFSSQFEFSSFFICLLLKAGWKFQLYITETQTFHIYWLLVSKHNYT